jgi:3'-5' exoribonuclease
VKSPYVSELPTNDPFHAIFLVHSKEIRQKKSGDPYLSLTLCDKTGDVDAKMWDNAAEVMDTFERDDFVRMKGILQIFQNRPQLTIHKLQRIDEREVDFADFFPASDRNPEEMWAELLGIVATIGNPHLRGLLDAILADPATAEAYRLAPAAKTIHHAFLSGLIEHVLSMCGLAKAVGAHYKEVDLDLLLAGVILHDIGKIQELTYHRGFGYSDDGQLLGHIVLGVRLIEDHIRNLPDFPPKLRTLLEHMILSHHGGLEFGSPKLPVFTEALLLHHLDNLDSKMDCMRSLCAKDKLVEGNWTSYSAALDRAVLKKLRYLDGQGAAAAAGQIGGPRTPQHATIGDLESKFNFSRNR